MHMIFALNIIEKQYLARIIRLNNKIMFL